jgi:hypothetical protein
MDCLDMLLEAVLVYQQNCGNICAVVVDSLAVDNVVVGRYVVHRLYTCKRIHKN